MRQLEAPQALASESCLEEQNDSIETPISWQDQIAAQRFPLVRGLFWGMAWGATALGSALVGLVVAFFIPLQSLVTPPIQNTAPEPSTKTSKPWQSGFIPYKLAQPVNLLLMGTDRVAGTVPGSEESFAGRSDTMLIVRASPAQRTLNVLSIPRDTQIEIPNYGLTKINHANWFGGPNLARTVIERNFQGLVVDRYLRVNTEALRALVDVVGGVRVFVPQDMQYTDQTQGLYIDLQEGWQTLDGDQAEQFARFRHDLYGDVGRVQRQQILLKALQQKLTSPQMIQKIPDLVETFQTYIDTNLTVEEMLALAGFTLQLDREQVRMVMLPGRPSAPEEFQASYWLSDQSNTDQILANYFDLDLAAEPPFNPVAQAEPDAEDAPSEPRYQPRIAVQNASGDPGQATAIARHLRDLGYWNVYISYRWPDIHAQTEIIVQRGDLEAATELQEVLEFGTLEMTSTGDLESDLTLRVGQDAATILDRLLTQHETTDVF